MTVFICVLCKRAGYSGLQAGYSELHGPESPGSYPESPGPTAKHAFSCVDIMSYASHLFFHTPAHPTAEHIRVSVLLSINMPIFDV